MESSVRFKAIIAFFLVIHCIPLSNAFCQNRGTPDEIPLWNAAIPNGPGPRGAEAVSKTGSITNVSRPRLIVRYPKHPGKIAILVISGGGYSHIEAGNESTPAADWLAGEGITAFELVYRLPGEGWSSPDVPFQDGQRAVRLIRSMAGKLGIDPHSIGIMGFSAGGHLAAMMATHPAAQYYAPADKIDGISARPDFAALIYPVITMLPPYDHTHSEKAILGMHPTATAEKEFSAQLHVNGMTPPTFLAQAADDPISNVQNSKLMYQALQKHGIPAKLDLFPRGGHGWGLGKRGTPEKKWPSLFMKWLRASGFLD